MATDNGVCVLGGWRGGSVEGGEGQGLGRERQDGAGRGLAQDDPHGIYGKHMQPCKRGGGYLRARQVGGDAGAQHWIKYILLYYLKGKPP